MAETEKHTFISAELSYICSMTLITLFFPHFLEKSKTLIFMWEEREYFPNLGELIQCVET